jgi:hypothetical protein
MLKEEDALSQSPGLAERRMFMKLPLDERRRILADQAEQLVRYYEQDSEAKERELWQGGDLVEL